MPPSGRHSRLALLLCLVSTAACNLSGFTEEPFERVGKSDGYCSRILRAQSHRKEVNNEFRLRVEGDPENYQPGSTYRVTLTASSPAYFRGFILVALREGAEGDRDEDYTGNFQPRTSVCDYSHLTSSNGLDIAREKNTHSAQRRGDLVLIIVCVENEEWTYGGRVQPPQPGLMDSGWRGNVQGEKEVGPRGRKEEREDDKPGVVARL
ncbi:hypothetical protein fugu_003492 [Takifugu bimaculatus]|uniref:Reelin domain-containing protein n=1 Tax=Takifugu bimaculatus TaxID=433685 RepID=A0A4Z2BFY2_9TELE|nr:hypothetical protein fugu_003492 [Takifugu bimaculatus]